MDVWNDISNKVFNGCIYIKKGLSQYQKTENVGLVWVSGKTERYSSSNNQKKNLNQGSRTTDILFWFQTFSAKPGAYITHNPTCQPAVQ